MKLSPPASSSDLAAARTIARRLHQRAYAGSGAEGPLEEPVAPAAVEPDVPRRPTPPPLPPRPAPPPVVEPPAREPEPVRAREPEPPLERKPEVPPRREPERPEPPPRREPDRAAPPPRREPERRPEPPVFREPEPAPRAAAKVPPAPAERPWSEPPPRRGGWTEEDVGEEPAIGPGTGRDEPEAWEPPAAPSRPPRAQERWEPPAVEEDEEEDVEVEQPGLGGVGSEVEEPVLEGPDDEDALAELTGGAGGSDIEGLADDEGPVLGREPEQEFDESQFAPPAEPEFRVPGYGEPGLEPPAAGEPEFEAGGIDPDAELLSAAEPVVYDEEGAEEELVVPPGAGVSPEDLIGGPAESPESWAEAEESPLDAEIEAAVGSPSPEDLIEVATPSWDDVADTCLELAEARGSMLVEATGQVVSARGDWPNPGPEAIANRLVAMMDRALRDAPTRSVSAPLAGQHLTAWRVPLGDSMLTAVFIGDAPVRSDARPSIDDEIRRAAGV